MLKQVFIINSDLKMGKGKVAVQVAHGEVMYMQRARERGYNHALTKRHYKWLHDDNNMMKKVVLKSTQSEMQAIVKSMVKIICIEVYDRGLTQVKPNSLTCLVVEPLPENMCAELFGHLKLL